jgi:hypothetical protein
MHPANSNTKLHPATRAARARAQQRAKLLAEMRADQEAKTAIATTTSGSSRTAQCGS